MCTEGWKHSISWFIIFESNHWHSWCKVRRFSILHLISGCLVFGAIFDDLGDSLFLTRTLCKVPACRKSCINDLFNRMNASTIKDLALPPAGSLIMDHGPSTSGFLVNEFHQKRYFFSWIKATFCGPSQHSEGLCLANSLTSTTYPTTSTTTNSTTFVARQGPLSRQESLSCLRFRPWQTPPIPPPPPPRFVDQDLHLLKG